MVAIFSNWYNKNENRRYPLVDGISASDGDRLPDDLVVDCNLWIPAAAGDSVWVSAAMVTDKLVTITIQANTFPSTIFTPVASISLVKPFDKYRPQRVSALYPGVSGWVSFGKGINNNLSLLFEDNSGTEILPKKVQRYSGDFLGGVSKTNSQTILTGLVQLKGAGDVTYRLSIRELDEVDARQTILIGLNPNTSVKTTHEKYLGVLGSAPENGNCSKDPILFINDVTPDCDGNIIIEFPPGIVDTRHPADAGIILDYTLGLIDVCTDNPGVRPREAKICDLPVNNDDVIVIVPEVPLPPPPEEEFPDGTPFDTTVCEYFTNTLTSFLTPKPQPPWIRADFNTTGAAFGPQSKIRVQLNVAIRQNTYKLLRNNTYGDHRNQLMQLEAQFGSSLYTSDPQGLGYWDNVGLIYNYQATDKYNFASIIWLGTSATGDHGAANNNAMLVIGHKTTSTKNLTPYGYDSANPSIPTSPGLNNGHFIDKLIYVEINPSLRYMVQVETDEVAAGVTNTTARLMAINPVDLTYIQHVTDTTDSKISFVSSTLNVVALSKVGLLAIAASDVFVTYLSVAPEVGCVPTVILPEPSQSPETIELTFPQATGPTDARITNESFDLLPSTFSSILFRSVAPADFLNDGYWTYSDISNFVIDGGDGLPIQGTGAGYDLTFTIVTNINGSYSCFCVDSAWTAANDNTDQSMTLSAVFVPTFPPGI